VKWRRRIGPKPKPKPKPEQKAEQKRRWKRKRKRELAEAKKYLQTILAAIAVNEALKQTETERM